MARQTWNVIATLERPRRIWAVAAIHANVAKLIELHDELWPHLTTGDRLVYLGNYLGYGEDIVGTIDELLSFRSRFLTLPGAEPQDIVFLRGMQEELWSKLLQIQFAQTPAEVFRWMLNNGLGATLDAYGGSEAEAWASFRGGVLATTRWTARLRENFRRRPGHDDLMASLQRAAVTNDRRLLFVSAGVDPHRPISEQRDIFWWGSGYFDEIDQPYDNFALVVRGFSRGHEGIRIGPYTASIDGGSGFGGPLNAICFTPEAAVAASLSA